MNPDQLRHRTKRFALQVIGLVRSLPSDSTAQIIGRQLLRSATSVGANYRSACLAKSKPDMIAKLKVVEEESDEAVYWLELLLESGYSHNDLPPLLTEGDELRRIMAASAITLRRADRSSPASYPIVNSQ